MDDRPIQVKPRVELKISRYNPAETRPWSEDFGVSVGSATTVLEALTFIKETIDPSLTFRASCRSSICGSCAVMVNGKSVLACKTRVLDVGSRLVIEPLAFLPVIRDLVVDIEPFLGTLNSIYPQLEPSLSSLLEETAELIDPTDLLNVDKAADCILCGCCLSACTVREFNEQFIGPAAFTKAFRFINDPRDTKRVERLQAVNEGGLWSCDRCMNCTEACPRNIAPERHIQGLKINIVGNRAPNAAAAQARDHITPVGSGARKAAAFTKMVIKRGRVNETRLAFSALGLSALGLYDIGVKLLISRKLSVFRTERSLKHKEVRELARTITQDDQRSDSPKGDRS